MPKQQFRISNKFPSYRKTLYIKLIDLRSTWCNIPRLNSSGGAKLLFKAASISCDLLRWESSKTERFSSKDYSKSMLQSNSKTWKLKIQALNHAIIMTNMLLALPVN